MSDNSFVIRPPDISDLEDIVRINRVSLPENYPVAYFIELIKSWGDTSCVAEGEDNVVGYILMRIEGISTSPWKPKSKKKAHIISVAVLPEKRRKGIATKMMNYIIDKARNMHLVKEITLEVRQSNLAAINLYRQLNFISHKIISSYYSDGEDAVLMKYFFE